MWQPNYGNILVRVSYRGVCWLAPQKPEALNNFKHLFIRECIFFKTIIVQIICVKQKHLFENTFVRKIMRNREQKAVK